EGVDSAVVREAHAARIPQVLGAARHGDLRAGLSAVLGRAAAFGKELELGRADAPLPRDELHSAGHGGGPPQCAEWAASDLDSLHVGEQQSGDVAVAAADVDRHSVEHQLRVRLVTAAEMEPGRTAGTGGLVDRNPR